MNLGASENIVDEDMSGWVLGTWRYSLAPQARRPHTLACFPGIDAEVVADSVVDLGAKELASGVVFGIDTKAYTVEEMSWIGCRI